MNLVPKGKMCLALPNLYIILGWSVEGDPNSYFSGLYSCSHIKKVNVQHIEAQDVFIKKCFIYKTEMLKLKSIVLELDVCVRKREGVGLFKW